MLAGWLPKVVHMSVSDANGAAQQALMDCGPVCWYSVGLPGPYAQGGGMACEEGNSKVWGGTESNLGRGQVVTYEEDSTGGNSNSGEGERACQWSQKAATHNVNRITRVWRETGRVG